jgi:hypothetical protein
LHRKRSRAICFAAITICSHLSPTSRRTVCSAFPTNGADGLFAVEHRFRLGVTRFEFPGTGCVTRLNERADDRHITPRTAPPPKSKAVSTPRTYAARRLRRGRLSGGSPARARLHGRPVGDDAAHRIRGSDQGASRGNVRPNVRNQKVQDHRRRRARAGLSPVTGFGAYRATARVGRKKEARCCSSSLPEVPPERRPYTL